LAPDVFPPRRAWLAASIAQMLSGLEDFVRSRLNQF
jgi:hypothetical protein